MSMGYGFAYLNVTIFLQEQEAAWTYEKVVEYFY
jgi:hypothetical protein